MCVWSLAPDYDVLTAHILVAPKLQTEDSELMRRKVQELAKRDYNLCHVTVQLEYMADGCHDEVHHFDHLHRLSRDKVPARLPDGCGPDGLNHRRRTGRVRAGQGQPARR